MPTCVLAALCVSARNSHLRDRFSRQDAKPRQDAKQFSDTLCAGGISHIALSYPHSFEPLATNAQAITEIISSAFDARTRSPDSVALARASSLLVPLQNNRHATS